MSSYITEDLVPVSFIPPSAYATKSTEGDTVSGVRINMNSGYGTLVFHLLLGSIGSAIFKVQSSAVGQAGPWSDVSGKGGTITDDNRSGRIELRREEIPDGHYLIRPYLYLTGGTGNAAVLVLAAKNHYDALTTPLTEFTGSPLR